MKPTLQCTLSIRKKILPLTQQELRRLEYKFTSTPIGCCSAVTSLPVTTIWLYRTATNVAAGQRHTRQEKLKTLHICSSKDFCV